MKGEHEDRSDHGPGAPETPGAPVAPGLPPVPGAPGASSQQDPPIPSKGNDSGAYGADVDVHVTQLMGRTKAGDRAAFEELVEVVRLRAYRLAHSFVGSRDDALELCQEAFLKTYKARASYRDGDPFLPWFHRILRNTCFSFLRKRKRIASHSLSGSRTGLEDAEGDWELVDDTPGPTARLESDETVEAFWAGFRRLKAKDREILALRHFDELSYREIARSLGIPEGTVMSRLFHARRRLREELAPRFAELAESPPAGSEGTGEGGPR